MRINDLKKNTIKPLFTWDKEQRHSKIKIWSWCMNLLFIFLAMDLPEKLGVPQTFFPTTWHLTTIFLSLSAWGSRSKVGESGPTQRVCGVGWKVGAERRICFPQGSFTTKNFYPRPLLVHRCGPDQWSLRGGPSVLGELPERRGREGPEMHGCFPGSPGAQAFHLGDSLARVRLGRDWGSTQPRFTSPACSGLAGLSKNDRQGVDYTGLFGKIDNLPFTQTHRQVKPAAAAAAAAKLLQSCPTLCDPIDGSPPGSPVPGILQARTLEWVAISFSNAWKWKVKVKSLSRVQLLVTPWTAAHQAPPSMGFSRQEYWSGVPLPSLSQT